MGLKNIKKRYSTLPGVDHGKTPTKFMPGMGLVGKAAQAIAPGAVDKMKNTKLGGMLGKFMGM